jgi:hypothetical protein
MFQISCNCAYACGLHPCRAQELECGIAFERQEGKQELATRNVLQTPLISRWMEIFHIRSLGGSDA